MSFGRPVVVGPTALRPWFGGAFASVVAPGFRGDHLVLRALLSFPSLGSLGPGFLCWVEPMEYFLRVPAVPSR